MCKTIRVSMADAVEGTMGVCLACGEVQGGVEPDASGYECEACGENMVKGIEEAILDGEVELADDGDGEEFED